MRDERASTETLSFRCKRERCRLSRGAVAAFTLAEVLITLGIIGVVAAMTIPILVADYQAKSWNTAASVFERKLEEALKVMNTQQTLAGHASTESFVNELKKHLKTLKICTADNLSECIIDKMTWNVIDLDKDSQEPEILNITNMKTALDLGKTGWDTETVAMQFANGTTAIMAYNPKCKQDPYSNQVTGTECISMIYDTSGLKSPNTINKDVRSINSQIATCLYKIRGNCYGIAQKAGYHTWNACGSDGKSTDPEDIKYMSKYGIEYCLPPNYGKQDYWATAAEFCGGADNMIQGWEAKLIAKYIYEGAESSYGNWRCPSSNTSCLNKGRARDLGFNFTDNTYQHIWLGDALKSNAPNNASYFEMSQSSTYKSFGNRGFTNYYTICKQN